MMRSLWTAKTGLEAKQTSIDVIANNLANVSTTGFKKQRAVFEDLLYQTMRQPGAQSGQATQIPNGVQLGVGVQVISTARDFTQGSLQQTGSAFDVAINGKGFFQVLMPDGTTAYTRNGAFHQDSQGQLVTANGYAIQPAITVPSDTLELTISKDGVVSAKQPGNPPQVNQLGQLQLVNFVNPGGLQSVGENLFVETPSSGAPLTANPGQNGLGSLQQTFLEVSNVNVAEELVSMIEAQRAYEINSKAIKASDEMLARLNQL